MDEFLIIALILIAVVLLYSQKDKLTKDESLVQDKDVNTSKVLKHLEGFQMEAVANRKFGFTEKDYEKQLEIYLKEIYQHVTSQKGIQGTNVKAIDLDIGRSKVGLELKTARAVIKEGGNDNLIGQIIKYQDRQYDKGNLIVCLVGSNEEFRNTSISDLEDFLIRKKIHLCWHNIEIN
jgi:hypothetical protein